jgi:S-adenosylmethionine hydrolase
LSLITLTSDLGYNNFALAEFKARFVSQFPQHSVLDLFHHQEIYDIESIAYQLLGALNTFPEGSIHLVYNKYASQNSDILITKLKNQFILAPNNGILSLIHFLDFQSKVYQIDGQQVKKETYQSWIEALGSIINGKIPPTAMETNSFIQTKPFHSDLFLMDTKIITRVLHTDSIGNIVLNIQKEEFYDYMADRAFYISFVSSKIYQLSPNYATTYNPNRIGAIFNATGFLELFMIGGNLAELFNVNKWKNNKFEILIDHDTNREINFQPRA